MIEQIEQAPQDLLDYTVNWNDPSTPVLASGETITGSTFTADSTDYTLSNTAFNTYETVFWLTGGKIGEVYYITNTITTSGGRTITEVIPYLPCLRVLSTS